MAEEKIIIEFDIEADEALATLAKAREELILLKKEQSELQKSIKNGTASEEAKKRFAEIGVEIKNLNGVIRANTNELDNQIKKYKSAEGSLEQIRAELKNAKTAYESLSEAERESARGQELSKKIQDLTQSAKSINLEMGGLPKGIAKFTAGMQQISPIAGMATKTIGKLGMAFKALIANPVGLVITAIVLALKKLVDAFKNNDQAMTALQSAFAAFKPILDLINKGFNFLVGILTKVVEGISSFVQKITNAIPFLREYAEAEEDIVRATDALEDAERDYATNHSNRNREIAELRDKATRKEEFSAEQRIKFLEDALQKEKEDVEEKKALAVERLRIAEKSLAKEKGAVKMTQEVYESLSEEQKTQINQLRNAVTDLDTELFTTTRRIVSQLDSAKREARQEEETKRKEAAENAKKRVELEKQALQQLEDLTIESMKNLQEKEEKQTEIRYQREIDEIKQKLKTEKNLTETARKALNQTILLKEAELQIKLGEISKKYNEQRIKERFNAETKLYQEMLKNSNGNTIELQKMLSDITYDTQIMAIQEQIKTAKAGTKELLEELVDELKESKKRAKIVIEEEGKMAADAIKRENQQLIQDIENNNLLGKYYNDEVEKTKIFEQQARNRLAIAEVERNRLKNLSEEQQLAIYGTYEKYQNALLKSENAVVQNQNAVEEAIRNTNNVMLEQQRLLRENMMNTIDVVNTAVSGINDLYNTIVGDQAEATAFSKALAMTQILISTAVSIVQAIEGATKAGAQFGVLAPAMIPAFIAELVGIVSSAIASGVGVLQKAKTPSVPKFAEGGIIDSVVPKGDNYNDDKINILASKGEYIMPRSAVNKYGVDFMESIRSGNYGGRIPQNTFNYEVMRDMLVEAVSQIQPEVSVKEIISTTNRVNIKENISKY